MYSKVSHGSEGRDVSTNYVFSLMYSKVSHGSEGDSVHFPYSFHGSEG